MVERPSSKDCVFLVTNSEIFHRVYVIRVMGKVEKVFSIIVGFNLPFLLLCP